MEPLHRGSMGCCPGPLWAVAPGLYGAVAQGLYGLLHQAPGVRGAGSWGDFTLAKCPTLPWFRWAGGGVVSLERCCRCGLGRWGAVLMSLTKELLFVSDVFLSDQVPPEHSPGALGLSRWAVAPSLIS